MRFAIVLRFLVWTQTLSFLSDKVVAQSSNTNTNSSSSTTTNNTSNATAEPVPDPWGGCVMEGSNADTKVKIGQKTIVCLQVANGTNWGAGVSYIRLGFEPIADQYSRLYVPNSFRDLASNNKGTIWEGHNITVGAASFTSLSFLRTYYFATATKIYPFLTAIIDVDQGVVKGITWDDSCVFCAQGLCEEITFNYNGVSQTQQSSGQPSQGCYIPSDECGGGNSTSAEAICDLRLYVVWTGTDANGRAFQSSQSRFGAFPPQDIYDEISQLFPTIPSITGQRI